MSKSKKINIAAYGSPTLWVTIDDLRVPVSIPDVRTAEILMEKLTLISQEKDCITEETYDLAFESLALLLSNNYNFMKFNADDLKKKNITVAQIINVLIEWVGFIGELANSKN